MDVNADFEFEALVPKSTDIIWGGAGGGIHYQLSKL